MLLPVGPNRFAAKAGDLVLLHGCEFELAISIFGAAILAASFNLIYLPIALAACVVAYVLLKIISLAPEVL